VRPKKFAAMHYLSLRAAKGLTLGVFEATALHRSEQFEWQYLNPVILYRTVEGLLGSPDNVLIGADVRWDFLRRYQVYGQVLLDEFVFSELRARRGWWGNKYGLQAGAKYANAFGINHLDLQVEYNSVRPYTYSHTDSLNSFTHFNQPLAHPWGANFRETLVLARWQPTPRLTLQGRYVQGLRGLDPAGKNYGSEIRVSNTWRVQDFGNEIGQGDATTVRIIGFDASYLLWHNLFADLRLLLRTQDSADDRLDTRAAVIQAGLRMNLWNQQPDF
jgi:hypothetical protein